MEQCLGHCEMAGRRVMRDGACRRYAAAVAMAEWRMFVEAVWRRTYGTLPLCTTHHQPFPLLTHVTSSMAGYLCMSLRDNAYCNGGLLPDTNT